MDMIMSIDTETAIDIVEAGGVGIIRKTDIN